MDSAKRNLKTENMKHMDQVTEMFEAEKTASERKFLTQQNETQRLRSKIDKLESQFSSNIEGRGTSHSSHEVDELKMEIKELKENIEMSSKSKMPNVGMRENMQELPSHR